MSRLIDAELIEKEEGWLDGTCLVIPKQIIYDASTVDAEPVKHGHWFDVGSLSCRCSVCGCKSEKESSYCPNCGAKMEEK